MDVRVVSFSSLPIIFGLIDSGLVQLCTSFQCGIPQIRHEALIVRGYSTRPGEWPWHAAIYHQKRRSSEYACGGTLINYYFVLTAAHCTINQNTGIELSQRGLFVRLGMHNLDVIDATRMQQYSVEDIYTSKKFCRENMRNDIALLKLEGSVQITDYVVPACINRQPNLTNLIGTSVGWGITENETVSPVLKMARLPVVDDIDCLESDRDLFGKLLDKGMFCAGLTNGTSLCNGDSGGGLFFKHGDAWYVGGIISFSRFRADGSKLCYAKGYTAFTKVVKYLSWMSNITGIDLDVGDGIIPMLPSPVITRKKVPYTPRLSDKKCLEYQQPSMGSGDAFIIDQEKETCWATIISERYLLGTGSCFYSTFDEASFAARFSGSNYSIFSLKPILHPNTTVTASGYVPKNSVILIDSGRDHVELKPNIECLWTDPNEITKEVFIRWVGVKNPNSSFNIGETGDGKAVTTNGDISCYDFYSVMGQSLLLEKHDEHFYRMVGPLIDCEPATYARLTDYLDWIEETVWPMMT